MRLRTTILVVVAVFVCWEIGCVNEPPLYEHRASKYLAAQGESATVIADLTSGKPLSDQAISRLLGTENVPVLHLVGRNPGASREILERLSEHSNPEVRTGVALNEHAPTDLLIRLRSKGRKGIVNDHLAMNPSLPEGVLTEMYNNREAALTSFAVNERCPVAIMKDIAKSDDELARVWLASNPGLPDDVAQVLRRDRSPTVRQQLMRNSGRDVRTAE